MKDFYDQNKGAIKAAIIMILATIILLIATNFMNSSSKTKTPNDAMETLGKLYYENNFYAKIADEDSTYKAEYFKKYPTGIKVTLRVLLESNSDINKDIFFNSKTKTNCNLDTTYVVITPNYPYGKSDYKLKVTTDCQWKVSTSASKKNQTTTSGSTAVSN